MIQKGIRVLTTRRLACALIVVKAVLFAVVLPPWQGPDEATRLEPVVIISRADTLLPVMSPDPDYQSEVVESMRIHDAWRFYEREPPSPSARNFNDANFPAGASSLYETSLAYLPAGLVVRWTGVGTVEGALYAARVSMILVHLAATLVVAWVSGYIFLESLPRFAVAIMYGLHPQVSFLAASVHPDNLGFLMSALVLATLLCLVQTDRSPAMSSFFRGILFMAAAILAGVAGYVIRKQLILVPFLLSCTAVIFWKPLRREGRTEAVSRILLIGGTVAFAFAVVLYHRPDWVGWRLHGYPQLGEIDRLAILGPGVWLRYLLLVFVTFWMALGSLVNKFGLGWLVFLGCVALAVAYGWARAIVSPAYRRRIPKQIHVQSYVILGLWLLWVVVSVLVAYGPHVPSVEGRYLLSALPSIVIIWVGGCIVGTKRRGILSPVSLWICVSVLLNWVVIFEYLIPIYYLGPT